MVGNKILTALFRSILRHVIYYNAYINIALAPSDLGIRGVTSKKFDRVITSE
jgi:hypothetical protein